MADKQSSFLLKPAMGLILKAILWVATLCQAGLIVWSGLNLTPLPLFYRTIPYLPLNPNMDANVWTTCAYVLALLACILWGILDRVGQTEPPRSLWRRRVGAGPLAALLWLSLGIEAQAMLWSDLITYPPAWLNATLALSLGVWLVTWGFEAGLSRKLEAMISPKPVVQARAGSNPAQQTQAGQTPAGALFSPPLRGASGTTTQPSEPSPAPEAPENSVGKPRRGGKGAEQVLEVLERRGGNAQAKDLAQDLGLSKPQVVRYLNQLVEQGRVTADGKGKNTVYRLSDPQV